MKTSKTWILAILGSIAAAGSCAAAFKIVASEDSKTDAAEVDNTWSANQLMYNPFFKTDPNWDYFTYSAADKNITGEASTINERYLYAGCRNGVIGDIYQIETYYNYQGSAGAYDIIHWLTPNYSLYFKEGENAFYHQATGISANPIAQLFRDFPAGSCITFSYFCVFDLSAMFGSGNEPTADVFHQQFQGYYAGYEQGITDGQKTVVVTSLSDDYGSVTNEEASITNDGSSTTYYNSKCTGTYFNQPSNIYWSQYSYGHNVNTHTKNSVTSSTDEGSAQFMSVMSFTKYLNTTEVDLYIEHELEFYWPENTSNYNTADLDLTYNVYYTTLGVDSYLNVSTWNVIVPIWPTDNITNGSDLIKTGTVKLTIGNGNQRMGISAEKTGITDSSFAILITAYGTYTKNNSWSNTHTAAAYYPTYWKINNSTATFKMDQALAITYEVVDFPGLLYTLVTLPFSFISTAFNITLFGGTPYALNIGSLILGILGIAILFILLKLIMGYIKGM